MGRGYAGADVIAELDIDYLYQGHDYDTFGDITNLMSMNLYFAQDTDTYATDIEFIMKQAEEYARSFLEQNGNVNTHRLYDSIKARRVSSDQWSLVAPARDDRGHLYAGHIEYGFTDKQGKPHGPWPFLRPALRLAAADSRGELADALANNVLYGNHQLKQIMKPYTPDRLAFGRSGAKYSDSKGYKAYGRVTHGYRRYDENGKAIEWGKARNGFNDYSGKFEPGTSSNEWSTSTDDYWAFGEL